MESQSCLWVTLSFRNCQMHWHSLLLSIPIIIPEDNEGQVLTTSLTCCLFFGKNQISKRWQGSYILILIPKRHIESNFLPKHVSMTFPRGIPYDYSCPWTKDVLMECVCTNCGLWEHQIHVEPQCKLQVKKSLLKAAISKAHSL